MTEKGEDMGEGRKKTDRQTDRQAGRQRDRETDGQRERERAKLWNTDLRRRGWGGGDYYAPWFTRSNK